MKPVDLSPAAESEWELIIDRDRKLAEAIEPVLDEIESGQLPGQMFHNHRRFTTLRIPGRDELYAIVWEVRDDHYLVLRIGKVRS